MALAGTLLVSNAAASETQTLERTSSSIVRNFDKGKELYIADRNELCDALTGGVISAERGAGLLTIDPENLTEDEKALIDSAESLYILGGRARVPESFEDKDNFKVRFEGDSRFSTAVKVAEELGTDRNLLIANGYNYVDAITSIPTAALENRNILLVNSDSMEEVTRSYLENYGRGNDIIFVGGENSISTGLKEEILRLTGSSKAVWEATIAGENRFETSLKIAQRNNSSNNLVLTSGYDFDMAINSVNLFDHSQKILLADSNNKEEMLNKLGQDPSKIYQLGRPEDWTMENTGLHLSGESEEISLEELEAQKAAEEEARRQAEEEARIKEEEAKKAAEAEKVSPAASFINAALQMEGWAYSQGQRNQDGYADCSSLVNKALINSGLTSDTRNLTSGSIFSDPRFKRISFDEMRPGDVLHSPGHLAIFMGEGRVFEAKTWGVPAGYGTYAYRGWTAVFRINGI